MKLSAHLHQRLFTVAGLVFLAIGMKFLWTACSSPAGDTTRVLFLRSGTLIGIGAGACALGLRALIERFFHRRLFYASVALLTLTISLVVHWCGMRQFGGFDHSVLIDYGWRLMSGERPFLDFPLTVPIGFFLGSYYAFLAFGVYWQSLVDAFAIFGVVTFLWSLWLLDDLIKERWLRLVFAFALQALCIIPVSYWWYNPLTTMAGVIYVLSAYVWLRRPGSGAASLSYFFALVLLAAMKPNVAGCLILLTTVVLLTSREHRVPVSICSCLAFLAFSLWLQLHGINLFDCLRSYSSVSGRAFQLGPSVENLTNAETRVSLAVLALVLLPLAACIATGRRLLTQWRTVALGLACILGALSNFVTAGESKLLDLGMILVGVAIVLKACGAWSEGPSAPAHAAGKLAAHYLTFIAVALSGAGIAVGMTRHRVRGIGMDTFFEHQLADEPFTAGFFRGLRSGRIFKEVYSQVESIVSQSPEKAMFFGPRMEWSYAAFRLPSPSGFPVWWHPGTSFSLVDQSNYIRSLIQARHDLLIFLKGDLTYYSPAFINVIKAHYSEDGSFSRLAIFRLRPEIADAPNVSTSKDVARPRVLGVGDSALKNAVTATVTIDIPSTAPSGEFGTRVSVPGVTSNDQLLLSPTQSFGTFGIYYEMPGIVVIDYINTTGIPQDPPPISFRVTALQF